MNSFIFPFMSDLCGFPALKAGYLEAGINNSLCFSFGKHKVVLGSRMCHGLM